MVNFLTKKIQTKRGFTLVELLVVISIIGFLSSTIFASLNSARDKSQNAYKISTIEQYRNALEFARNDLNGYPWDPNIGIPFLFGVVCLATTNCNQPPSWPISTIVNNKLAPYITVQPPFDLLRTVDDDLSFPSPLYQCNIIRASDHNFCDRPYLNYALKGSNTRCGLGAQEFHFTDTTDCYLLLGN